MSYITAHWSFDPFLVVSALVVLWHELGLHRLAARSRSERNAVRRQQSLLFYAGLAVVNLTVASPLDYWSDRYFWVHMIQHLLLMFAAPVLLVVGAPWMPLVHGLPVGMRRRLGRALLVASWSAPLRAVIRALSRPWIAVIFFNVVMIFWHLPGPFDLGYRNQFVHIFFMHGSFLVAGVFFWRQFIGSYPLRPKFAPGSQVVALFTTNVVMFFLALGLGMFARVPSYPVYAHLAGVTLSQMGDQQIGCAILWVCGDFWCFPSLYRAFRKILDSDDDQLSGHAPADWSLDRLLSGPSAARLGPMNSNKGRPGNPDRLA